MPHSTFTNNLQQSICEYLLHTLHQAACGLPGELQSERVSAKGVKEDLRFIEARASIGWTFLKPKSLMVAIGVNPGLNLSHHRFIPAVEA